MSGNGHTNGSGLSSDDKFVVDRMVQKLGYHDLEDLVHVNGCKTALELVAVYNFTSVRDFFIGEGWDDRLEHFRRSDISVA